MNSPFISFFFLKPSVSRVCLPCYHQIQNQSKYNRQNNMRRTKSLNDFDKMKENISKLIRSQQVAIAESCENEEESSCCYMSVLPLELLANILEFLPFEDVKQCRHVSRFWLSAVSLTKFYKRSQVNLPEWVEEKVETLRALDKTEINNFKLHNFPFDSPNIPLTCPTSLVLKDCEVRIAENLFKIFLTL